MPKTTSENYRLRLEFTKREENQEYFTELLRNKEFEMTRYENLPKNCEYLGYRFRHEEGDFVFYDYFEDEEDSVVYRAVVKKDRNIYKDWLAQRAESLELEKRKWGE